MGVQPLREAVSQTEVETGPRHSWWDRARRISLTGRLFLLVTIAVLPALIIQAVNETYLRLAQTEDIRRQVIATTHQFGGEVGELREGARQLLLTLSQLDVVRSQQVSSCNSLFAKLKGHYSNYAELGAADSKGQIFCSSGAGRNSSVAHREFFTRAIANNGFAVGRYWADPADGKKMIHFAIPFLNDMGRVSGVVYAGLDLDWLSEHFLERRLAPNQSILIADREGNVIARLPHPERFVGKNMRKSHERLIDGDKAGWEEAKGVDGVTRIFGFVPPALPPGDFFLSAGQTKEEAFAPIDRATTRGVGLILAALFAALFAAWAIGKRYIQRPIAELVEVTGQWRHNVYDARFRIRGPGSEIDRLGHAFNEMADALAARQTAQGRAEAELRAVNAKLEERTIDLEEASKAKSRFLANVSHEIRTPLSGVLGMLDLASQTDLTATQTQYIEGARHSAETLLGVISDVLDLSKIEAGRIDLETIGFDLREIVEDVTDLFAKTASAKCIELSCWVPPCVPTALTGDPGRLRQILANLVGNAVKFTDRGEVSVCVEAIDVEPASALLGFEIIDTGIGIPVEKQTQIFDAFVQADASTTRRYGGTGLGLTIAKQLCEIMGGALEMWSRPSEGSRFRFMLRFARQPEEINSEVALFPTGGRPVLIVEKNPAVSHIMLDYLSSLGITALLAASKAEAVDLLRAATARDEPFGLAIVDLDTPETAEFARTIASGAAATDLSLIALTSFNSDLGDLAGRIVGHLTKPVRLFRLRDCLSSIDQGKIAPPVKAAAAPLLPVVEAAAGPRVLMVEDDAANLAVGSGFLESLGCVVETATNGREALELYGEGRFDIIFIDCQMPEMDGFQATAEIRRREKGRGFRAPIVALTASAVAGDREKCLAAGMDDYLSKPYTRDRIAKVLQSWLPRARSASTEIDHTWSAIGATASPPSGPIDYDVLRELDQIQAGGVPNFVRNTVRRFLESAPPLLRNLEEGVTNCDVDLLYRASHRLKSSSGMVGARVMSTRCELLERQARGGTVTDAAALVAAIVTDYEAAASALLAHITPRTKHHGEARRGRSSGAPRSTQRRRRPGNHKHIQDTTDQSNPGGDHEIRIDT
jgi:two-component system, sensor histidine kinase and response regulator